MLGAMPAVHEEVPDLNMSRLTAGGRIGLVLDDHLLRPGLTDERPPVTHPISDRQRVIDGPVPGSWNV
jgi:hypothetical protein